MSEQDEVAAALTEGLISTQDGETNVVDALTAIARGLDRIGAALDGPWPAALAEALYERGLGRNTDF